MKNFELAAIGSEKIKLSKRAESGPVVLVILCSNPGYQSPICTTQIAECRAKADEFKTAGAQVISPTPAHPIG